MKIILIILGIGLVILIANSTYHYIKMQRCLKEHQTEWDERKYIATDLMPDITQDELMVLYLDYCKEIHYRYIPRF